MPLRHAIFLDRDGTINENRADHVKSLEEFIPLPGAIDAICQLAATPLAIVIISNQSVINRRLTSADAVDRIHRRLLKLVETGGGRLDGIYICPHTPDEHCACRKPRPGLLDQAQKDLGLDLTGSYVVGDAATDVELALNAGCTPIFVLTGRGRQQQSLLTPAQEAKTHICKDLVEAAQWIIAREKRPASGEAD